MAHCLFGQNDDSNRITLQDAKNIGNVAKVVITNPGRMKKIYQEGVTSFEGAKAVVGLVKDNPNIIGTAPTLMKVGKLGAGTLLLNTGLGLIYDTCTYSKKKALGSYDTLQTAYFNYLSKGKHIIDQSNFNLIKLFEMATDTIVKSKKTADSIVTVIKELRKQVEAIAIKNYELDDSVYGVFIGVMSTFWDSFDDITCTFPKKLFDFYLVHLSARDIGQIKEAFNELIGALRKFNIRPSSNQIYTDFSFVSFMNDLEYLVKNFKKDRNKTVDKISTCILSAIEKMHKATMRNFDQLVAVLSELDDAIKLIIVDKRNDMNINDPITRSDYFQILTMFKYLTAHILKISYVKDVKEKISPLKKISKILMVPLSEKEKDAIGYTIANMLHFVIRAINHMDVNRNSEDSLFYEEMLKNLGKKFDINPAKFATSSGQTIGMLLFDAYKLAREKTLNDFYGAVKSSLLVKKAVDKLKSKNTSNDQVKTQSVTGRVKNTVTSAVSTTANYLGSGISVMGNLMFGKVAGWAGIGNIGEEIANIEGLVIE